MNGTIVRSVSYGNRLHLIAAAGTEEPGLVNVSHPESDTDIGEFIGTFKVEEIADALYGLGLLPEWGSVTEARAVAKAEIEAALVRNAAVSAMADVIRRRGRATPRAIATDLYELGYRPAKEEK